MSVLNTTSLFREVKWQRLESRVKEPLKFNVPIFGSYTLPACEKKKQSFNFHKQTTKYNGPQPFPLRSSSILMISYSTVHNKKT